VLNELNFVIAKMVEEKDPTRKLYYFSGVRTTFERASRYYYDGELLVAQIIADASYQMITDRWNHVKAGDLVISIPEDSLKELVQALLALKNSIEADQTILPDVKRIIEVAYSLTGPGFYTRAFLDYVKAQTQSQEGTSISGMRTTG
jgi:hypothetical protein